MLEPPPRAALAATSAQQARVRVCVKHARMSVLRRTTPELNCPQQQCVHHTINQGRLI